MSNVFDDAISFRNRRLYPLLGEEQEAQPAKRRRSCRRQRILLEGESSSVAEDVQHDINRPMNIDTPTRRHSRRRGKSLLPTLPAAASYKLLKAPIVCVYCGAKKFEYESPGFCCSNGEVIIATNDMPEDLVQLYSGTDDDCVNFQCYSRLFNNFFAFSSLGGSFDCNTFHGIYVFKLHGQIYHFLPNLIPSNECPKYLQLYIYDSQEEHDIRSSMFENLRPSVIARLMKILECNPYGKFFKSLAEKGVEQETIIRINKSVLLDQRVFNAPTTDEVAAIWSDRSASSSTDGPYIVVSGKAGESHRIQHYYGCYDPLQYPLLFPHGENGWHPGIPKVPKSSINDAVVDARLMIPDINSEEFADANAFLASEETAARHHHNESTRHISCRQYYAYMLQIRRGNRVLTSGRLLLQYIVDMYVKLENTRLDFLRNNQKTVRADIYQGLIDSVIMGCTQGEEAGHRIILPPSFIGGPRDMKRRYLNAMALVQKFGKPDIFATMTCNPNWPEIKAELGETEKIQNRPDLIARIFKAKLMQARNEMVRGKLFGEVAAFIYVVEFQKRGLPHAHFLIILKSPSKVKCPEDFDRFVCAEIPNSDNLHLRTAVLNHMMHGPCGTANPLCPCMKKEDGKTVCKSRYPKSFSAYTTTKDDGYPLYKRADTGETVRIRGHMLDNRWVIPYNPYLLATFDCHFNVEICSTIQAVKYLYKYVYKGHDRVSFNIGVSDNAAPIDEIENYQSGRWVSSPEAAWRIFSFDLFEMMPPVMPLHVHCEKQQSLSFGPNEQLEFVVNDRRRKQTPLTEFFRMNAEHPQAEKLLYAQFPEYYTWDDKERVWKVRKRGIMVGRLAFVGPAEKDRFFLRLLLANVKGPTSYINLKTVDGVLCQSFQEACIKRKLLDENNTVDLCLHEAAEMHMPQTLRCLFVSLLIFCAPPNPAEMWDRYYEYLSEDFRYRHPNCAHTVLVQTVANIEELLENMGRALPEFGLQHLTNLQSAEIRMTRDVRDVLEATVPEEYILARSKLNVKQTEAFNAIMHHVSNNIPGIFFVDGPGGTGKTFLYGALYAQVHNMGKIVLPTASSGIAASCLPSGRTAHSRFKLPLDHDISLSCNVSKQGSLANLLRETTLIIWDEAPMANKASIHALDLLLQDICDCTIYFGGKIVVFGGDFRQVLPVVPHKTQTECVEASLVCSYLWSQLKRFYLTENMRARQDPEFAEFLLALGDGKLQHVESASIKLPDCIQTIQMEESQCIEYLMGFFNPSTSQLQLGALTYTDRAILTPRNDEVDVLNRAFIERFDGESVIYKSFDELLDEHCNLYPTEFLNSLCPGGMSPHELILKVGCPVMLLRNIDPANGICNGTRLVCKKFFPTLILCSIAVGYYKGRDIFIHRINLRPAASSHFPFQFERRQFPIKLCFAMTINKAQGQTLNEVGIYLRQPCFSHGQLYVALSRARCSAKAKVFLTVSSSLSCSRNVRNVVSYEVLRKAGILQG